MGRIRAIKESSFAAYRVGDEFEVEDNRRIVYLKLAGDNMKFPFLSSDLVYAGFFEWVEEADVIQSVETPKNPEPDYSTPVARI